MLKNVPLRFREIMENLIKSRLVQAVTCSALIKVAFTFFSFLISVVLARALGATEYGVYTYVLSLISFLTFPAQAGLPTLVVRETARGLARDEAGWIRGIWIWAGKVTGGLSVLIIVVTLVFIPFLRKHLHSEARSTLFWALILVPLVVLGNIRDAALRGLGHVIAGQIPELFLRPLLFLILIIIMIVIGLRLTATRTMELRVISAFVTFAVGSWLLWKHMPPSVRHAKPIFAQNLWLSSTFPLALVSSVNIINNNASLLILGLFTPARDVGIYKTALQTASLASLGLQAINIIVAPQFAELYVRGDVKRLRSLVIFSARISFIFSILITLFFLFFGSLFLRVIFGSVYEFGYIPLLILLIGQLVNSVVGSVGNLLNMTGYERETAKGMMIAAGLNVALCVVLIPRLSVNGAAIATMASLVIWNALLWNSVRKKLGINSFAFNIREIK